ncbi:MAG: hypothetical protein Q7R41_14110 [Phycisphaerales bacterium]|nr:hypothetical protein [Phycisphaerales bacterium]
MAARPESQPFARRPKDDTFREILAALERILGDTPRPDADPPDYLLLCDELRRLHACFRVHQASDFFNPQTNPAVAAAPQLGDEFARLGDEHSRILGLLDWLIRHVDAMPDRPVEDRDVFLLRLREMIAVLRRHEAEEDRLLITLWHDTGGES